MSAHHDELQDIENAKHFWKNGGKWIFAFLLMAALVYLGKVIYDSHIESKNHEAATIASEIKGDISKLTVLQQQFANSTAVAQASLETAGQLFVQGKYDDAIVVYRWILDNNKTPLFQAAAAHNLAVVLLQQKKYDDALAALDMSVEADYQAVFNEARGDIFSAQGKKTEASGAYQAALDKLPENAPNREWLQMKKAAL
ncbi:MAG: tetratricopeptide repeat protein [Alysiella sp.]|uniref:YfgM family protein n=1 Tax=Alysiella sp. TaxID=1872483 RepID=UPI0026DBA62D|nr:tetratricopeptide repeat protein [Alysiella sp.]MDO4434230.1 tetratricopeptide repeat protein [Alysiella sp.]